ncbi:ATP-binding protein [Chloracidobacterium aggregatum]|uniref:ATP-binding protein n=1 Tax=Chloracidobacterium sp. N TaxID=2821540 RepID=A0ABX8B1G0_9BACT|nr:ATP-binding protein [Chloracidobacterium aggregatum]QUV84292.1 ATP-binding protein [Chloracidobacterium sp. 2]QUV87219.1 ATP-binding protein [Chloracidobacterium sp. S]QUV90124.1 ATP-binding protein [Chloracidobacterium sp. A]QUV93336.1 ATP-binding protein [Chloracidobacterium sp. N]QUV96492.1 ATP-binding protein [Chloracidobacterium sp. E]
MSATRHLLTLDELSQLPHWAAEMGRKYFSGEASHFLLHHNVYDLARAKRGYVGLVTFLQQEMLGNKHIVLYNRSEGISFGSQEAERQFLATLRVANPLADTKTLTTLPRDPVPALGLIERFLYAGDQVAVIINFLETLVPAGEMTHLSSDERNLLVMLQRWLTSSRLLNSDNIVLFITENLSDVAQRFRENSRLTVIRVPYPDHTERLDYIRYELAEIAKRRNGRSEKEIEQLKADFKAKAERILREEGVDRLNEETKKFNERLEQMKAELGNSVLGLRMQMSDEQLAHLTSGLNRVHISSILKSATLNDEGLTIDLVRAKKKSIIEAECVGLIEFVTPKYGLDHVGGFEKAKAYLRNIAEVIRRGETEEAPMGILISGPVGTGKTFLAEAFAKDCGLNVVEFKNFRDKWVGSSESNLEKILNLIQTLAPIVVLIDEADATLGNRDSGGDSGVDKRIFSKIAAAMGDTDNRGRILWILMTSRPDLLPIDLKRQGRAEEHISLFYPESEADRLAIVEAMIKKNRIAHQVTDWSPITKSDLKLSGADIESILIRCRRVARQAGRKEVSPEDVRAVAQEFTPARDEVAIEYQTLVAVREATSRDMLPEAFRHLSPAEISQRIEQLRPMVR